MLEMDAMEAEIATTGSEPPKEPKAKAAPKKPEPEEPAETEEPVEIVDDSEEPQAAAPPVDDKKAKQKQFEELAKELGVDLKVTAAERYEFRQQKKRLQEALSAKEQEIAGQIQQIRIQLEADIQKQRADAAKDIARGQEIFAAKDKGDFDAIAKALGFKDFADLTDEGVTAQADPANRRLRAIEREREEERQQAEKAKEAAEKAKADEDRKNADGEKTRRIAAHKAEIGTIMQQSVEPVLKELSGWQFVRDAIYDVQLREYDPLLKATYTPEQVLDIPLNEQGTTMRKQLEALRDSLIRGLGGAPQAQQAIAPPVDGIAEDDESAPPEPPKTGRMNGNVRPVTSVWAPLKPGATLAEKRAHAARQNAALRRAVEKASDY